MSKIQTKWIADDAVDKVKINADVAGAGLVQAGGGELDVNVDDSSIEVATDVVQVKALGIATGMIAGTAVTAAKLGSDVAGNGLGGGSGAAIVAVDDLTGGANLSRSVNVNSAGLSVKVDADTITENGSKQLAVGSNSIGAAEIDETDSYTWTTGTHDFTGAGSISVKTPTSDAHAVTKIYADGLRAGVAIKDPCRALADSNQTISGLPTTIDGVGSWSANERILLTNQSTPAQQGIWEVQSSGWSRPTDFAAGDHCAGAQTWINEGTSYGDSQWTCTTDPPNDVIDTDTPVFSQTSGAGQISAGVGLTKSGNTIRIEDGSTGNVNGINRTADAIAAAVDNSSIEIASNVLAIKALGVGTSELAATSVTAAKLGSDVAGDGLTGGNGADLDVEADLTGGANIAKSISVASTGIAIFVDDSTIEEGASSRLAVKDDGITALKLNADTAGDGIQQEAGGSLGLDINGLANTETVADNADLIAIYDQTNTRVEKMTRANFLAGVGGGESVYQEMHLITSGETTAGYWTLTNNPVNVRSLRCTPQGGPMQVNKDALDSSGATGDFQLLSTNQLHFNNNGAGTALSGDMTTGDICIVEYQY